MSFAWHAGALLFLSWVVGDVLRANRRLRGLEDSLVPLLVRAQACHSLFAEEGRVLSAAERGRLVRGCRFLLEELTRTLPGRPSVQVFVPALGQTVCPGGDDLVRNTDAGQLDWTHVGPALARLYELLAVDANGLSSVVQDPLGRPSSAGQGALFEAFVLGASEQKAVSAGEALRWLTQSSESSVAIKCVLEAGGRGEILWRLMTV